MSQEEKRPSMAGPCQHGFRKRSIFIPAFLERCIFFNFSALLEVKLDETVHNMVIETSNVLPYPTYPAHLSTL